MKLCLLTVVVLGALYGSCQNGQWLPGGSDDAFYLSVARNLAGGKGYTWGGGPVVQAPPGWPVVLAAAMWLSRSFVVLNLMLMAFCLAAACLWYRLMRRFTSAWRAFGLVVLTGVLFEWHRFTFTHYSEALFYLLFAASLLLAFQISENRPPHWRVPLLAGLCAAMIAVRYAGLLTMAVIVCALATGRLRPRANRQWIAILLVSAVSLGSFFAVRGALRRHAARVGSQTAVVAARESADRALGKDSRIWEGVFGRSGKMYLRRGLGTGEWVSMLLWPVAIVGRTSRPLGWCVDVLGWATFLLCVLGVLPAVRQRQWAWLALLFYVVLVPVAWGRPVARYLAPVAPMLLLGVCRGIQAVGRMQRLRLPAAPGPQGTASGISSKLARAAVIVFLASVGACNGTILTASAWTARSRNFHQLWLAGEYADLLRTARYLRSRPAVDGTLAVCAEYRDLNRRGGGAWAQRVLALLADQNVRRAPGHLAGQQGAGELLAWAEDEGVRLVLTRAAHRVRRVWHLRLPLRNASELDKTAPFYVLHEITGNRMVPVELPEISSGLRSVPVRASALRHSATGGPPFLRPACADRIPTACGF